jgi:hypothetical protein
MLPFKHITRNQQSYQPEQTGCSGREPKRTFLPDLDFAQIAGGQDVPAGKRHDDGGLPDIWGRLPGNPVFAGRGIPVAAGQGGFEDAGRRQDDAAGELAGAAQDLPRRVDNGNERRQAGAHVDGGTSRKGGHGLALVERPGGIFGQLDLGVVGGLAQVLLDGSVDQAGQDDTKSYVGKRWTERESKQSSIHDYT